MKKINILVGLSYNPETGEKKETYADVPIDKVTECLTKLKQCGDN